MAYPPPPEGWSATLPGMPAGQAATCMPAMPMPGQYAATAGQYAPVPEQQSISMHPASAHYPPPPDPLQHGNGYVYDLHGAQHDHGAKDRSSSRGDPHGSHSRRRSRSRDRARHSRSHDRRRSRSRSRGRDRYLAVGRSPAVRNELVFTVATLHSFRPPTCGESEAAVESMMPTMNIGRSEAGKVSVEAASCIKLNDVTSASAGRRHEVYESALTAGMDGDLSAEPRDRSRYASHDSGRRSYSREQRGRDREVDHSHSYSLERARDSDERRSRHKPAPSPTVYLKV
eukprot:366228-Chlamydomonas_euryale.AAC.17